MIGDRMNNKRIDLQTVCGISLGDDINSYHFKKVFGRFDLGERITDFFIGKIDEGFIPWAASWCQPWPVNYLNKEEFRGLNFFMLRSNYAGFCPYWVPRSHILKEDIQVKKGEKGTPVILKKDGVSFIENFFNLEQLDHFNTPRIDKPVKPPVEKGVEKVLDYFKDFKKCDNLNYKIEDFNGQDPDFYYYLLFQYFCYNWYCQEYNESFAFKPDIYSFKTLIFRLGAAFLAAYCKVSTPYYSITSLERNKWKMVLMEDKNALFETTAIALKMYDVFIKAAAMRKAS